MDLWKWILGDGDNYPFMLLEGGKEEGRKREGGGKEEGRRGKEE